MTTSTRRKVYVRREPNIRQVFYEWGGNPATRQSAGFEVRIGQTRASGLLPNITQAREARDAAKTATRTGSYVAPAAGKVTVKVMADRWLNSTKATKWKPRTRAGYEGIVRYRLSPLHDVPVKDVTAAVVDGFIAGLIRQGLRPSTVRHVYHVLNQAMRLAVRDRHITANPCAEVERPGLERDEPRIPQMADVEALLDALRSLDHAKAGEWALYAELAAYAGLRAGEITGLRVKALDPLRYSLRVTETVVVLSKRGDEDRATLQQGTPKSKAGRRTVPLSRDLSSRLAAHVQRKDRDAYVFGDGTTPFRHSNFYRRIFRPAARELGLETLTFHQLRHFYASLLLTNPNLNAVDISKMLGHADANLLFNTYGHSFDTATEGVGDWLDGQRSSSRAAALPTVRRIG